MTEQRPTLAQVAVELGVTPERVRQIEQSALRKLRAWCQAQGITFQDLTTDDLGWSDPVVRLPRQVTLADLSAASGA